MPPIETYLKEIRSYLRLDPTTEHRVLGELQTYFDEKIDELETEGFSEAEAVRQAISSFGKPRTVAKLIHEAHSRGSWLEALLAAQPHLLGAALFATHLWSHPFTLVAAFTVLLLVALLGWLKGRPNWLYPWIGCAFAPILAVVFLSRNFLSVSVLRLILGSGVAPEQVKLLLFVALYGVAFAIVLIVVLRIVRRDWLLVSFMLVPLPVLGIWISAIDSVGDILYSTGLPAHQWDLGMVLALLLLGAVSAVFIRIRQRVFKTGLLLVVGVGSTIVAGWSMLAARSFFNLLLLTGISLFTFLLPATLETVLGHGESNR